MSTGFHSLQIAEVRREIADAVSLRFAVPDALAETYRFAPGQHLTLRAEIGGEEVRRNYSICAANISRLSEARAWSETIRERVNAR